VTTDLAIAQRFGWKYQWVGELPREVYDVLVEELAAR
jgi:hypothetical protein